MKKTNKKGVTLVELVIVIAVIAILAAVLIPTFNNMIQKAKDSAYLQDRTNKQTEGTIEKIDNPNYMTWEDFEDKFAEALAKAQDSTAEKIQAAVGEAIKNARFDERGITDAQIKDIIERTLEGQLTDAQVKAIVEKAVGEKVTAEEVTKIVNKAISNLPKKVDVTKEEMTAAIKTAVQNIATGLSASEVETRINDALAKFDNDGITDNQIADIVSKVLAQLDLNKLSNEKVQQAIDAASATPLDENMSDIPVLTLEGMPEFPDVDVLDVTYRFDVGFEPGEGPELNSSDDYWLADYEVSFDKAIEPCTVFLGGEYLYNGTQDLKFALPVFDPDDTADGLKALPANKKVRLLKKMGLGDYSYNDVVNIVNVFDCGVKNMSAANEGTKITVKLCLYRCDGSYGAETGESVVCASITYTLKAPAASETTTSEEGGN